MTSKQISANSSSVSTSLSTSVSTSLATPLQAIAVLLLPLALVGLHYLGASPFAAPSSGAWLVMRHAWAGGLILFGLAYASGLLPWAALWPRKLLLPFAAYRTHHAWLLWAAVGLWTSAWVMVWLTLPTGFLISTLAAVLFFGVALRSMGHGDGDAHALALRKGVFYSLLGLLACTIWYLAQQPFRVARAVSDWLGPLDVTGRHHPYAQVLIAWRDLQLWGPGAQASSGERINVQGTALLQFMTHYGAGPGALLGAAFILAWWALWRWLQQAPFNARFSNAMRRMGLALLALHGVSTVFYVLFNMGLSRQTFGPALPTGLAYLPWFLLTPALGLICWQARRAPRVIRTTTATPATTPFTVTTGVKNGWLSLLGYGLATAGLSGALLIGNDHLRETYFSQTAKLTRIDEPPARQPLLAANGEVLAHNVDAHDLWVTPSEFWAVSLLNPQSAGPVQHAQTTLNDAARQRHLLDALGPWPHIQSIVKYRLASWPKSKNGLVLLAWTLKPEVANALRALAMPGILLKPRPARHYPEGPLYAHALGFVGSSDNTRGQDGLELRANRQLMAGTARSGLPTPQGLTTTLVPHIQRAAHAQLHAALLHHRTTSGATGGAVVVIDVEKNTIAALVSAPDFDPNDATTFRNPYQPHRLLNRAAYPPFPVETLLAPLHAAQRIETGQSAAATTSVERLALYNTLGLDATAGTPVQANLLQVLNAYIPLATAGYLRSPSLLATPAQPARSLRVLSNPTAAQMRHSLPLATLGNGTLAAGITATLSDRITRRPDTTVLIGMWPTAQPQWLMGVVLEYPPGQAPAAGRVTLPLFAQVAPSAMGK